MKATIGALIFFVASAGSLIPVDQMARQKTIELQAVQEELNDRTREQLHLEIKFQEANRPNNLKELVGLIETKNTDTENVNLYASYEAFKKSHKLGGAGTIGLNKQEAYQNNALIAGNHLSDQSHHTIILSTHEVRQAPNRLAAAGK